MENWKDAFMEYTSPDVLTDRLHGILASSREERHRNGCYTWSEINETLDLIEANKGQSMADFIRDGMNYKFRTVEEARREFLGGVKAVCGMHGGQVLNADIMPSLEIVVGDCLVTGTHQSLRHVTGGLSVDGPSALDSLRFVGGDLALGAPCEATALKQVGGTVRIGDAAAHLSPDLSSRNAFSLEGVSFSELPEDTKTAARRNRSRKFYRDFDKTYPNNELSRKSLLKVK